MVRGPGLPYSFLSKRVLLVETASLPGGSEVSFGDMKKLWE